MTNDPRIFRAEMVDWWEPPGHYGAFSKLLVTPENVASRQFDFRISSYQPKGYVASHVHPDGEHVYYILRGTGVMELEGQRHLIEPNTCIFIPAGCSHGIANTGFEDFVFIVVSSPPSIMERPIG